MKWKPHTDPGTAGRDQGELIEELALKLRQSEKRFRSIIEKSADAILIIDQEGIIRFANPESESLFGRSLSELQGQAFGYPVTGARTTEIEILHQLLPPTVAEMKVVATSWADQPAQLATLRDISARKRLETELQRALSASEHARDQIDTILRSVAEGLIVTDNEGRVVLINQAAELLLGVSCRQVLQTPIEELFRDQIGMQPLFDNLASNCGERFDFERPAADGKSTIHLRARGAPILDHSGRQLGQVTILQNVTQEREIEQMKSEFVSLAAHELGSPLTCIIGFAEVLLDNPRMSPEDQRNYIGIIREQGFAMRDIVDTFLDLARIESGQPLPLKPGLCTVTELLEKIEPFIRVHQEKYHFELDLAAADSYLLVDRKRLGQVLENLLGNAVKYSPAGTRIRLSAVPLGAACRFSIQDQGVGMTPEQVERIFDKFYRAPSTDQAIGGLGLGMSIVKYLIEAHGGTIGVESRPGAGTTVWFTLPCQVFDQEEEPQTHPDSGG